MRILLATEGTYPYVSGGVSTWADALVRGLPEHDFTVVAVVANPHVAARYDLPPNASVLPVPLWGSERVEEYLPRREPLRAAARTTGKVIGRRFLPVLDRLVGELIVSDGDAGVIGECVLQIARFCCSYDLRRALRDERAWDVVCRHYRTHALYRHASMQGAIDLARSLYRYLMPLALPLPAVDVAHASAAAFCALPALAAKLGQGVPLVLTEHGVYVRERILQLVRDGASPLRKVLLGNLYRGVARAIYQHADVVAPVCSYNTVWERELTVREQQLRVIHNGTDPERFVPGEGSTAQPTVAYVGRIDPLKDVLGLVAAAALVHEAMPDVRFRLYGADTDEAYGRRCRRAVAAGGLEETIVFEGPTDDVGAAYRDADVVVLPSRSEGFPFTVVEAMMSARTVVATRVGGVPEALGDERLLVPPQNPSALAAHLVRVLEWSRDERAEVGRMLHERASELFTEGRFLAAYSSLYDEVGRAA